MSKFLKHLLVILAIIGAAALGVLAWKKYKAIKKDAGDSSDIFEEDDVDFDDAV